MSQMTLPSSWAFLFIYLCRTVKTVIVSFYFTIIITQRIVHGGGYNLEMIAARVFRLRSLESAAFRRWLLRPAEPEIRLVAIAGGAPARVRNPEPVSLPKGPYTHQRTLSPAAEAAAVLFGRTPGSGNANIEDRDSHPCVGIKGFSLAESGRRRILKCIQTTKNMPIRQLQKILILQILQKRVILTNSARRGDRGLGFLDFFTYL